MGDAVAAQGPTDGGVGDVASALKRRARNTRMFSTNRRKNEQT